MQIVIDIDDVDYEYIKNGCIVPIKIDNHIYYAIRNGKPLPKGHKRLIEDDFEVGPVFDKEGNRVGYQYITQEDLNNAPTIIEAESEE